MKIKPHCMDWFSSNLTFNAVSAILVDLSDLSTNSVNLTYPRSSQQAGMHDTHSLSGVLGVFIELTQNDSTRVEYSPVVIWLVFVSNQILVSLIKVYACGLFYVASTQYGYIASLIVFKCYRTRILSALFTSESRLCYGSWFLPRPLLVLWWRGANPKTQQSIVLVLSGEVVFSQRQPANSTIFRPFDFRHANAQPLQICIKVYKQNTTGTVRAACVIWL